MSVFKVVGLSIAYNPEDREVAAAADIVIQNDDLRAILPYVIPGFQQ